MNFSWWYWPRDKKVTFTAVWREKIKSKKILHPHFPFAKVEKAPKEGLQIRDDLKKELKKVGGNGGTV